MQSSSYELSTFVPDCKNCKQTKAKKYIYIYIKLTQILSPNSPKKVSHQRIIRESRVGARLPDDPMSWNFSRRIPIPYLC